jgi:hypothetical protein
MARGRSEKRRGRQFQYLKVELDERLEEGGVLDTGQIFEERTVRRMQYGRV